MCYALLKQVWKMDSMEYDGSWQNVSGLLLKVCECSRVTFSIFCASGSGKTLAYLIPVINRLRLDEKVLCTLVVAPLSVRTFAKNHLLRGASRTPEHILPSRQRGLL